MTQDQRNSLPEVVADMETDLSKAIAFAAVLSDCKLKKIDDSGYCVELLCDALQECLERLRVQWDQAFSLSHPPQPKDMA
jgi:hypothetical protein